ncbi:Creatinase/aminopeptidase [Auricularia subglabra TFB-10046 SS5]|nr:Creatinase/aminopeptidase [Auricularia subglabra TFB-10046 SS5]
MLSRLSLAARRSRALAPAARCYATVKPAPFGQPRPETHPHLLKPGEITPGIQAAEYEARRTRLMDALPSNSVVVAVAAPVKYMSGSAMADTPCSYRYRQDSNLFYLTGWQEPSAAVVMRKSSAGRGYELTAFVQPRDPQEELWEGARTGLDAAVSILNADQVFEYDRFLDHFHSLVKDDHVVFVDSDLRDVPHWVKGRNVDSSLSEFFGSRKKRRSLRAELGRYRAIKSPAEQAIMRQAADITADAHTKTMCYTKAGLTEAQLEAHFTYVTARAGSQRLAYVPVVASGANGLAIHYVANTAQVEDGELVLMDAGCEYNGYASDLSRTWPVSGTFTSPQRDLYAAVLSVQKAMINLCTEASGMTSHDLQFHCCQLLSAELARLGFNLRDRDLERIIFPHAVSHSVGVDLHEPNFDAAMKLQAGMVITIEPGIYVPPHSCFPSHFHNQAIRIEDEILVQETNATVLTASAPKELVDVEAACQDFLHLGSL